MHGSRGVLAAPLVALAVLAGPLSACSSGTPGAGGSPSATSVSSSPTATPSGSPSASAPVVSPPVAGQVAGTGYRFAPPAGWRDATARFRAQAGSVDRAAAQSGKQADGFADNVNVVVADAGADADKTPAQFSAAAVQQLRKVATGVRLRDDVDIAGREALHTSGLEKVKGIAVTLDQYVVVAADTVTVVTFSFTRDVPAARRARTMSQVLASWSWS